MVVREAIAAAPDKIMPPTQRETMLHVDIEGLQNLAEGAGINPLRQIVIRLELDGRLILQSSVPASEQMGPGN